jgi:hypothetical protein
MLCFEDEDEDEDEDLSDDEYLRIKSGVGTMKMMKMMMKMMKTIVMSLTI